MAKKFLQGKFPLKNPDKYMGGRTPTYRSSWEWAVMQMFDNNAAIERWGSEVVRIPYRDPLTGKQTIYVPDFFVVYNDKNGRKHAELWEVKPANQAVLEKVGKNKHRQAAYIRNQAKWEVARLWCKQQGLIFRVISENDIFHQGSK
jgi:hypothetical protein